MPEIIRWWEKKSGHFYDVSDIQIEAADSYWLAAHTKFFNGAWETAIVRWRYRSPYLIALIRDGKKIAGEDE